MRRPPLAGQRSAVGVMTAKDRIDEYFKGCPPPSATMSDVARAVGVSRQRVEQLAKKNDWPLALPEHRTHQCIDCGEQCQYRRRRCVECRKVRDELNRAPPPLTLTCATCGVAFQRRVYEQRAIDKRRGGRCGPPYFCRMECFYARGPGKTNVGTGKTAS